MGIVIEREKQLELRDSKPLNTVPQRLGILPSFWFWNQKEHWRLVRWPFAGLAALLVLIVSLTHVPAVVAGVVASVSMTLALGLLERYVRARANDVRGRRKAIEPSER